MQPRGVSVTLADPPPAGTVARLAGDGVASRLAAEETWVGAVRAARPLAGEVEALGEQLRVAGLTRIVLVTAGGAGPAAALLTGAAPRLVVLDSPDPVRAADALAGDLDASVLVVSVPPGADTTAAELLWDTIAGALRADGLDPDARTVLVAPPGSGLIGRAGGARVVLGAPDVAGPWAALTAYTLVPAGLAGVDVATVLADAAAARDALGVDAPDNPALELGALLAGAPVVALAGAGAEWVAPLVAAALGGGPLPVVVEAPGAPGWDSPGALTVGLGGEGPAHVVTHGPPAAQMQLWLHATAVAARLCGAQPPGRPAVPAPAAPPADEAAFADGAVDVHAAWLPARTASLTDALRALVDAAGTGHLAVHAYLDPTDDASVAVLRPELTRRTGLLTTFGWAPRCLPTAGAAAGAVCQVTGSGDGLPDVEDMQLAGARADAAELGSRGRPVLRVHLTDRVLGLVTLVRAVQEL